MFKTALHIDNVRRRVTGRRHQREWVAFYGSASMLTSALQREPPRHPCPSHFDVVRIVQTLRLAMIRFARPLQPTMPSLPDQRRRISTAVTPAVSPRPRLRRVTSTSSSIADATDAATQATSDGMDRMGRTRRQAAGSQHREACVYGTSQLAATAYRKHSLTMGAVSVCMAGYEHCFKLTTPGRHSPHPLPRSLMSSPHRPLMSTRPLSKRRSPILVRHSSRMGACP
jgi:hypothetical protein